MAPKTKVDALLEGAGLLFEDGQGGILVMEVEGGIMLQNTNPKGEPIGFTDGQVKVLRQLIPKLGVIHLQSSIGELLRRLKKNTETSRRVVMLEERQKSGLFSLFESLDPTRPIPPLGTLTQDSAAKILPRTYAALDLSDPNNPSVAIWGSEFAVPEKGVRLDEGMFVFDVDQTVATRIAGGERIADVLSGPQALKVSNARIVYMDDNISIAGMRRLDHHLKSLASLQAWAVHVLSTYNLEVSGDVYLHVEDEFLDPPRVSMKEKIAEVFRKRRHKFFLSMNVKAVMEGNVFKGLEVSNESKVLKFMKNFDNADRKAVLAALDTVVHAIGRAMKTVG